MNFDWSKFKLSKNPHKKDWMTAKDNVSYIISRINENQKEIAPDHPCINNQNKFIKFLLDNGPKIKNWEFDKVTISEICDFHTRCQDEGWMKRETTTKLLGNTEKRILKGKGLYHIGSDYFCLLWEFVIWSSMQKLDELTTKRVKDLERLNQELDTYQRDLEKVRRLAVKFQ